MKNASLLFKNLLKNTAKISKSRIKQEHDKRLNRSA